MSSFLDDMGDKYGIDPYDTTPFGQEEALSELADSGYDPFALAEMTDEEVATLREAEEYQEAMHQQQLANTCGCEKPDENYLLNIDCGTVELKHATCGKPPRWTDWPDISFSNTIAVAVKYGHHCDCNLHEQFGNDCGPEIYIKFPGEDKT